MVLALVELVEGVPCCDRRSTAQENDLGERPYNNLSGADGELLFEDVIVNVPAHENGNRCDVKVAAKNCVWGLFLPVSKMYSERWLMNFLSTCCLSPSRMNRNPNQSCCDNWVFDSTWLQGSFHGVAL